MTSLAPMWFGNGRLTSRTGATPRTRPTTVLSTLMGSSDGTHLWGGGTLRHVPDILIATDADAVFDEVSSVVAGPDVVLRRVRRGPDVRDSINARPVDLTVVDLQIGSMGGVAVALDLQLESDAGRLVPAPILLLLDRRADVFLARRSGVQGWLLKPLDPRRIRRATSALLAGGTFDDDSYLPQPVAVPFGATETDEGGGPSA